MGFNFDLHSQILTTLVKKCQTLRDMCKVELHPTIYRSQKAGPEMSENLDQSEN